MVVIMTKTTVKLTLTYEELELLSNALAVYPDWERRTGIPFDTDEEINTYISNLEEETKALFDKILPFYNKARLAHDPKAHIDN